MRSPAYAITNHIIIIKFGNNLSQQMDVLWKLYRKCQLPGIKSDQKFIDDFYKVIGPPNCYTVSTGHEYLRSRSEDSRTRSRPPRCIVQSLKLNWKGLPVQKRQADTYKELSTSFF